MLYNIFFSCCIFWLFFFWSVELLARTNYPFMVMLSVYKEIHKVLFIDLRIPMEIICEYLQAFTISLNRLFTYKQRLIYHLWFFWKKSDQFKYLHACFNFLYKTYKNVLFFMTFFTKKVPFLLYRLLDLWYAIVALFEGFCVKFLTYFSIWSNPIYKDFKKDVDPLEPKKSDDSGDKPKN